MTYFSTVARTLAIALALIIGAIGTAHAASYAVVVNSANGFKGDQDAMMAQVSRILLKGTKSWPGGEEAVPFSRKAGDAAYEAMLAKILGMSQAAYDQHWAKLKQTTGDTPPREVGSVNILFRLIGKKAGAVAIVSADDIAKLPEGAKVLFTFDN